MNEKIAPSDKSTADYNGLSDAIVKTAKKCVETLRWLDSAHLPNDEFIKFSDEIGSLIVLCADLTKIGMMYETHNLPISLADKTQMYSALTDARNYCAVLMTPEGETPKLENSLLVASPVFGKKT